MNDNLITLLQDSRDILNEYINMLEKNDMTSLAYGHSVVQRLNWMLDVMRTYESECD